MGEVSEEDLSTEREMELESISFYTHPPFDSPHHASLPPAILIESVVSNILCNWRRNILLFFLFLGINNLRYHRCTNQGRDWVAETVPEIDSNRRLQRDHQGGQIGLVVDCEWAEAYSQNTEDREAAARRLDFQLGWYLDPIYYGDYPKVMREKIGDRLPEFSEEDIELLRNSVDFVGLNHYTTRFIAHANESPEENDFYKAQQMKRIEKWEGGETIGEKAASEWLYVVPWGIRKVLNYIAQRYNDPPIYVTENGMDDEDNDLSPLHEMLDDKLRTTYYKRYLAEVAQAVKDGVDVRGYFAWSLLDNFEWAQGYTKRFGLIYVDHKNGLSRHPKSSAYWFSRFLKGHDGKSGKDE